jgi:hypothetical protein
MPGSRLFILALLAGFVLPLSAQAATLTVIFSNNGEPLEDPLFGKFYLYEPGTRENYLSWGHAGRPARVPDGVYDLVITYHNDTIREQRVFEEVELEGDVEQEAAFSIPVARLVLRVTSGGEPVPRGTGRYQVHRAGQRGKPLASRRPGAPLVLRAGTYDIEVSYRDAEGLQSRWLEGYYVEDLREETVEMGSSAARLEVTVTLGRQVLPAGAARWRVYLAGSREASVAERRSGESVVLDPGRYDVGVFYDYQGSRGQRWLNGLELHGLVRRRIDISDDRADLQVHIRRRGRLLSGAWFSVFPAGDRRTLLLSAHNGAQVELEPGNYDIRCTVRSGGLHAEQWLTGQSVADSTELSVEMEYRSASLRLLPNGENVAGAPANVLLIVDSSAAMSSKLGVRSRMNQVSRTVAEAAEGLNGSRARLGLRAYGILPPSRRDCRDSLLLVPPAPLDRRALSRALTSLRPSGLSPIAYSLEAAGGDLPDGAENVVVLITGGPDSCDGDPCAAATRLLRSGEVSLVHVLGLGIGFEQGEALACAGNYQSVTSAAELKSALREIFRAVLRDEPGTVNLFEPAGGGWVAGGYLRERLEVNPGRYDVQIRTGGEAWVWENVELTGSVEADATARPPRRLR